MWTSERPIPDPDPRVEKLPKWAQDYIQQLGWAAQERETALNKNVQAEESRVQVAYQKVFFPDHTTFAFRWSERDEIHVGFRHDDKQKLRVSVTGSRLVIHPEASNTISIFPDPKS